MDDNLAIFLVLTIAIVGAVLLMGIKTWVRAKHGAPRVRAAEDGVASVTQENAMLRGQIARLEERLSVLERIAEIGRAVV